MNEKIMKKYTFLILLVAQGYLGAMEKMLERPQTPLEKSAVLEEIVVSAKKDSLYQIESVNQTGLRCGYFSLCNCLRIMSYLEARRASEEVPLVKDKGKVKYAPVHAFNWNTDFLNDESRAWQYIINQGMITLSNEDEPASVRDIMQAYMKKKLNELSTLETDDSKERNRSIMGNILMKTLVSIEPKINFDNEGTFNECIVWSIDKNEFIKQFRLAAITVEQQSIVLNYSVEQTNSWLEHMKRVGVIARKVSSDWINQIFDEEFITHFNFFRYKEDKIGARIHKKLNCQGMLSDNHLVDLIGKFPLIGNDGLISINLLGGQRTFETFLAHNKGCEKEKANSTGSLQSLIVQYKYEIGYSFLLDLKEKMMNNPNADIIEGFIVRVGNQETTSVISSSNQPQNIVKKVVNGVMEILVGSPKGEAKTSELKIDEAHWVSLVVSRLKGEVRYYVADSLANRCRIADLQIQDIISFLEDKQLRKESLFYIDPGYLDAAQCYEVDENGKPVKDEKGQRVPLTVKSYMNENPRKPLSRSTSQDGVSGQEVVTSISNPPFSSKSQSMSQLKPSKNKESFPNVVKPEITKKGTALPEEDHPQEGAILGITRNQLLIGSAVVGSVLFTLYMLKRAQKNTAQKDPMASPPVKKEDKEKIQEETDGDDEASILISESSALGILSAV